MVSIMVTTWGKRMGEARHEKAPLVLMAFGIAASLLVGGGCGDQSPDKPAAAPPPSTTLALAVAQSAPPRLAQTQAPGPTPEGMVFIPGGEFSMGSEEPMMGEDARPVHRVAVDAFWMDATEVTNAQFAKFVDATHYVTVAERTPRAEDFPGAPPENLVAGSVVFAPPAKPVPLDNHLQWWTYVKGANWRHPEV